MSEDASLDPYDVVPYGGCAVEESHPDRLWLSGLRHGIATTPSERCRVLEIGCAEGRNLAPMAFQLPDASFAGIDGSKVHIERAIALSERLGLDNLQLSHRRIEELELGELGEHDYVIVHGVFSWIDDAVRHRLLDVCRAALAPNGLLFLSFNCAPGWAMRGMLRRAISLHASGATDEAEKIARARSVLEAIAFSPVAQVGASTLLSHHARSALGHRDAYLRHEYLAEHNHAFHYSEVAALAGQHGLAIVDELARVTADPELETSLRASMLARTKDPVEAEELVELALLRPFRRAVLRRDDARASAPADLASGAFVASAIRPAERRVALEPEIAETFVTARDLHVVSRDPWLKAALLELGKSWPCAIPFAELFDRARAVLTLRKVIAVDAEPAPSIGDALAHDLLALATLGHVLIGPRPIAASANVAEPRVSALTRAEVALGSTVTNAYHENIALDALTRALVPVLDGTRGAGELVAVARDAIESGAAQLKDEAGAPLDLETRDRVLPELVERSLATLAKSALLC